MKRIIALSVGLWVASWSEAENPVQQMLPLTVENRWDYQHIFIDRTINTRLEQNVTVSITHTEDIEGHTYYVFSDMPYEVPSVPYFFLAGKKVRWEGNHLLFRQQDRDVALYQFGDQEFYRYIIPKTASDTLVVVHDDFGFLPGWPRKAGCLVEDFSFFGFAFIGHDKPLSPIGRSASILKDFGMVRCVMMNWDGQKNPILENRLISRRAVINGVKWEFWNDPRKVLAGSEEFPCIEETAIRALSWGVLKQKFTSLEGED